MRLISQKALRCFGLLMVMTMFLSSVFVFAADEDTSNVTSQAIQAQIANLTLKIDGFVVDNYRSLYPILFYQNITYFPITYNYMQALGLQSHWDEGTGLSVVTNPQGSQKLVLDVLNPFEPDHVPNATVQALTPTFAIKVQGQSIRGTEDALRWPFLLYNDITYIPATWSNIVTYLGLKLDYDEVEKILSVTSYQTPVTKLTLADVKSLPQIFDINLYEDKPVGLSSTISITTTSYGGTLLADKLNYNYDGIIDPATGQILYTLTPDQATASKLNLTPLQVYIRPVPNDENRMRMYVKEGSTWQNSSVATPLTPDLFSTFGLSKDDLFKKADNYDAMGLTRIATYLRDPSNANFIYNMLSNFGFDKMNNKVTLSYKGTVGSLLADMGITDNNLNKFYGYILAMDDIRVAGLTAQQGVMIRSYLEYSDINLSFEMDATTGDVLNQTLKLDFKVSETDSVALVDMKVVYNYKPVLNFPEID